MAGKQQAAAGVNFMKPLLFLFGFFLASHLHAEVNGIIIVDEGRLGREFATAIEFSSYEAFAATVSVNTPSGKRLRLLRGNVLEIIEFPDLEENLTLDKQFHAIANKGRELVRISNQHPDVAEKLEPVIDRCRDVLERRREGFVLYRGQWVEKAGMESKKAGIDITTRQGKTYRNVVVTAIDSGGFRIVHATGGAVIPFSTLDKETRSALGYDGELPGLKSATMAEASVKGGDAVDSETGSGTADEEEASKGQPQVFDWKAASKDDAIGCVVVFEGKSASGSGFLCNSEGQTYIYTNAHVISGNPGLKIADSRGNSYQDIEYVEAAGKGFANGDVVRLKLKTPRQRALRLSEQQVLHDQDVMALGNSQGEGVVTVLRGEIAGVGPDKIEITADIVQGNSGGPIVDEETFEVVGISTYGVHKVDVWSKNTELDRVRRFGLRPANVRRWERFSLRDFINQGRHVQQLGANIQAMRLLKLLEYFTDGIKYSRNLTAEGEYLVGDLIDRHRRHPIVRELFVINDQLEFYKGSSRAQMVAIYKERLRLARSKVADFRWRVTRHQYAWFHRKQILDARLLQLHADEEERFAAFIEGLE